MTRLIAIPEQRGKGKGAEDTPTGVPLALFLGIRILIFPLARIRPQSHGFVVCLGGDKRDRTADLLNAIQALSQLSYTPIADFYI